MGKKEAYRGRDIIVYFDSVRCIHSRHCVLGQPKVFRANAEGPWIKPDSGSAELIAGVIRSCPSGALTYKRLEGGEDEALPEVNVIRTLENGPLAVHGDIRIDDEEPMLRATLCRCGASKNKPFCDGSHKEISFVATGEPETIESKPLEKRDGLLKISPLKDGPLMITGNAEICSGTGRTVIRTQETALCRCGASNNKPFCDGSHAKIGFTSD
ncbi:MAG: CDGSH iron-sulfur domain-containing protein [Thermodesulfobacteriota bacterium]